jgi:dihydrolipoamide dehydrogenase
MTDYDIIILGAGPGGYVAAERAGHAGQKVLLIEEEKHLGGVCLNWGCIPTKTLLASAKVFYQATHGDEYGVSIEGAAFKLEQAMQRKTDVQNKLRQGVKGLMKMNKVKVVHGRGEIKSRDNGLVSVAVGDETFQAPNLLIATGSRPAKPPIPGADQAHVLDSSGILEIDALPKSLAIIGGGVIGVEFACFFASVGVDVSVIEMAPEITPGIDTDIAKMLRAELTGKGVTFHVGAKVDSITADAVNFTDAKGAAASATADMVLMATGRLPNIEGIGLENIGVELDRRAIRVDAQCRTNVPGVYAIGDVNAKSMLAHSASRMGEVAVNTILGKTDQMRYKAIPGVVYTSPEVAVAGLTEQAAKELGVPVKTAKWPLQANGRFLAAYNGKGLCKAVVHAETHQLLGAHFIGAACSEMIHGACVMIEAETRVEEIREIVFPHPTVSESLRDAVFNVV